MSNKIGAVLTSLVLFPILLFSSLVYMKDSSAVKRALALDFKSFNKAELWFSFVFAFLLSALLAYSAL